MSQQQKQHRPIQDSTELSEEGKRLDALFGDMETKQLDFLDSSSKTIIERIATFLAVLFAVTVLSNKLPPPYLQGNIPTKVLVIVTLVLYLGSSALLMKLA